MFSNHHHHVHLSHQLKTEFSQVFAFRTIRALGASLISVFIPIFLYSENSDNVEVALLLISGYYVILFLSRLIATVPTANLVSRIGGKHVLVLSAVFDSVSYLLLAYMDQNPLFIAGAAIMYGIGSCLFFTTLHMELSSSAGKRKAHKVGSVEIARKTTMALGPFIGGIVATAFGFTVLAFVASTVILLAGVSLHLSKEPLKGRQKVDPTKVREFLTSNKSCAANFGMGINTGTAMMVWPLFIYIFLTSYTSVGYIVSLSLLMALLVMFFVRRREQPTSIDKEITIGGRGSSFVHLARVGAINPVSISLLNFLHDILEAIMIVPYTAQYYINAIKHPTSTYVAAMEISYSAGVMLIWPIVLVAYSITHSIRLAMAAAFVAAAIGVFSNKRIQEG